LRGLRYLQKNGFTEKEFIKKSSALPESAEIGVGRKARVRIKDIFDTR